MNKLFHNPNRFKRIKVTEMDVMKPYIIIMGMNLLVLSCWTAIAPLTYKRYDAKGTDDWNRVIETYGICTSESESNTPEDMWPFLGAILAINISLLLIANVQAYQARSIQTEYSESKYIMIIMTCMAQMFALAVPCISLLSQQPEPYFIVMIIVIFCVSTAVLGFMFLPKILHTRSWMIEHLEKEKAKAARRMSKISQSPSTATGGDDGLTVQVTAMKMLQEDSSLNQSVEGATDGDDGLKVQVAVMKRLSSYDCPDTKMLQEDSSLNQSVEGANRLNSETSGISRVKFTNSTTLTTSNTQFRKENIEDEKEEISASVSNDVDKKDRSNFTKIDDVTASVLTVVNDIQVSVP